MMPSITSCTPESSRTTPIKDAQQGGGDEVSASARTIAPPTAPMPLKTKPVIVLTRSGMTEKLTNMLVHSRRSRRNV